MRIGQVLTISIPMSIFWMILTNQINFEGFLVGLVFSTIISSLLFISLRTETIPVHPVRAPKQIVGILIYGVQLAIDIFFSGMDVTSRVLGLRPIRPGIIAISTQLQPEDENQTLLSGLSAHGITITPGQLVVDFDGTDTMYVHCLDAEESAETLAPDQIRRLGMLKRMLGND